MVVVVYNCYHAATPCGNIKQQSMCGCMALLAVCRTTEGLVDLFDDELST